MTSWTIVITWIQTFWPLTFKLGYFPYPCWRMSNYVAPYLLLWIMILRPAVRISSVLEISLLLSLILTCIFQSSIVAIRQIYIGFIVLSQSKITGRYLLNVGIFAIVSCLLVLLWNSQRHHSSFRIYCANITLSHPMWFYWCPWEICWHILSNRWLFLY